jgi:predicted permease
MSARARRSTSGSWPPTRAFPDRIGPAPEARVSLLALKLIAIAAIVVTALLGGLAAARTRRAKAADRLFSLGSLFGAGVFLGAGLIHMLPDAVEALGDRFAGYPMP